tara:strand:+ start:4393 stop:4833 length:441 start_codon:yes stop_codon:yes gene_type:complete
MDLKQFKKEELIQQIIFFLEENTITDLNKIIKEIVFQKSEIQYFDSNFDYIITEDDSFLNYCLNNTIPKGCNRNRIVLKNLAPILVKLGLDKNHKIKKRIIDNMPGKNIMEIEGWIKRAREGKLHLNIYEVNKWGKDYGVLRNKKE